MNTTTHHRLIAAAIVFGILAYFGRHWVFGPGEQPLSSSEPRLLVGAFIIIALAVTGYALWTIRKGIATPAFWGLSLRHGIVLNFILLVPPVLWVIFLQEEPTEISTDRLLLAIAIAVPAALLMRAALMRSITAVTENKSFAMIALVVIITGILSFVALTNRLEFNGLPLVSVLVSACGYTGSMMQAVVVDSVYMTGVDFKGASWELIIGALVTYLVLATIATVLHRKNLQHAEAQVNEHATVKEKT